MHDNESRNKEIIFSTPRTYSIRIVSRTSSRTGVARQGFDWRYKILSSLDQFTPKALSSEVECDELELALSDKGNKKSDRKPRRRGSDFKRNQEKERLPINILHTRLLQKLIHQTQGFVG